MNETPSRPRRRKSAGYRYNFSGRFLLLWTFNALVGGFLGGYVMAFLQWWNQ